MKTQHSLTIAKNSVANLARLGVSVLVALVLPPFLTRRLSHDMYAAWVLILQLSAYGAIFELGLQVAISKFVAQHDANNDYEGVNSVVSTATALLGVSAACAMLAVAVLVWQVPHFFGQLTPSLVRQVRMGILLVGGSTALSLPAMALASSFMGLQRNGIPMAIQAGLQALTAMAIVLAVLLHGNLVVMGACVAALTLAAGLVQVAAWRKYLSHIQVSVAAITRQTARLIIVYCAAMSVWSFAMLLISGLDTAVVAHFDFKATGYYAVAAAPTNFIVLMIGAIFGPLLPAVSALAAVGDHAGIASLTLRTTRYCALLLVLTGLPLLLYGHPILSIWVGADYARHSSLLLEILVIANLIRLCLLPYSVIVIGNGLQRYGFLGALTEAFVNLGVSIALGSRFGAVGVAIGTLAGAVFGFGLAIFYCMRCTFAAIPVLRAEFLLRGLARPLVCAVPLVAYLLFCKGNPAAHGYIPPALVILLTAVMIWNIGLTDLDRKQFASAIRDRLIDPAVRA